MPEDVHFVNSADLIIMARNNNGRGLHAPTRLLDLPPDLNSLKLVELKTLCQRLQLMERVARSGRLNVKAPYIEVLEAFLAASAAPVNDSSATGERFCINTETPSEADAKCFSINTDAATKRDADIEVTNCTAPNERTVSKPDVVSNCVDLTAPLATVVSDGGQNPSNTDAISDCIGSDAESSHQKADVQASATNERTASKQYAENLFDISAPSATWEIQSSRMASNAEPESDCTVVKTEECAPAATSQTETDTRAVWQYADDSIRDRIALNADIASSCGDCNADGTLSSGGEFVENPYGALDSDAYESLGDEPTQAEPLGGDAKVSVNSSLEEPRNGSILMGIGCSDDAPPTVSEQLESGNPIDSDALTKLLFRETVGIDSERSLDGASNPPQGEASLPEQQTPNQEEIASKRSVGDAEAKKQTVAFSSIATNNAAISPHAKSIQEDATLNDCCNCESAGEEKLRYGGSAPSWGYCDRFDTVYSPSLECDGTGKLTDAQLMNYQGIPDDCHQPSNSYCTTDADDCPSQDNPDIPPLAEWLSRARGYYANEYGKDIEQIQILPLGENPLLYEWGADDAISYPLDTTKGYRVWIRDDELENSAFDADDSTQQTGVNSFQEWTKVQTALMAQKYGEAPERIFLSMAFVDKGLGDDWNFKETLSFDETTKFAVYILRPFLTDYSPATVEALGNGKNNSPNSGLHARALGNGEDNSPDCGVLAAALGNSSENSSDCGALGNSSENSPNCGAFAAALGNGENASTTEWVQVKPTVENVLNARQLAPHRKELERILSGLSKEGQQLVAEGFLRGSTEPRSDSGINEAETINQLAAVLNQGIELIFSLQILRQSPENSSHLSSI